jgi:hypothetical protein
MIDEYLCGFMLYCVKAVLCSLCTSLCVFQLFQFFLFMFAYLFFYLHDEVGIYVIINHVPYIILFTRTF